MNRDFSMPQQKKSNIIRYTLRGSDNGYHTKQKWPFQWAVNHDELCPIGSMYAIYGITFTINIPQSSPVMLAYIPAPWILWVLYPFIYHHHSSDFCISLSSHPSCTHDENFPTKQLSFLRSSQALAVPEIRFLLAELRPSNQSFTSDSVPAGNQLPQPADAW